jgi:hypothetical protein
MKVYKKDEINRDKNNGRQQSNLVAVNKSRLLPHFPLLRFPPLPPLLLAFVLGDGDSGGGLDVQLISSPRRV